MQEMAGHRLLLSIIGNKIIKKVLGLTCNEFTTSYRISIGATLYNLKDIVSYETIFWNA